MKKFWGYTSNNKFSVGCTGQTVYLYDKDGNELNRFKDIIYGYTPMISPDGKIFVVKSTDGRFAVYSLETFSLIEKNRYTKFGDDNGFCFSPDGLFFINIECVKNGLDSAISIYNTYDFSLVKRIYIDDNMMLKHIEYDKTKKEYYILGFVRGDNKVISHGFVGKFENNQITDIIPISKKEFDFLGSYKSLEISGFTEKKYEWTYIDYTLEELKNMNYTLAKLYEQKKAE